MFYFNIYCSISRSFIRLLCECTYSLIIFTSFSFTEHCYCILCIWYFQFLTLKFFSLFTVLLLVPTIFLYFLFCYWTSFGCSIFSETWAEVESYRDLCLILPVACYPFKLNSMSSFWTPPVLWIHISSAFATVSLVS